MVNHETDKRFVAVIVVVFESNIVADTADTDILLIFLSVYVNKLMPHSILLNKDIFNRIGLKFKLVIKAH